MRVRLSFALLLLGLLLPSVALAQGGPVQQSGPMTPGHVPAWVTNGVVGDGGPAGAGNIKELGITNTGTPACINDAPTTGPYHQLCLGANALGAGLISYNAYNGAPPLPLNCSINGAPVPCLAQLTASGMPTVATNAFLLSLSPTGINSVYRDGFYNGGDGGAAIYRYSVSACSLNGGSGDNGLQVPASGGGCWLASLPSSNVDVRVWGADATGANDSTQAIQNCLTNATSVRSCFAGNGRYKITNGNLTIPNGAVLNCGFTFGNQEETPATFNTAPAILLSTAQTISAGGNSAGIRNCAILQNGVTWPAATSSGYAGIAVSDAGYADFSVTDSVIVGFDTCIYNTGKRPLYRRNWLDCNGVTKAALELDVGNTDSGYVTDIKIQFIGTSGSNCAGIERPGTGLRVGGTGGAGVFLDRIVSEFFNVNFDFEQVAIAGTLWGDGVDFESAGGFGCTRHSTGVLVGPGGGFWANFLSSNGTYVGIQEDGNGLISYAAYLSVNTGNVAGSSNCINLGDGTHIGSLSFGFANIGFCGGTGFHVKTAGAQVSGHTLRMAGINGGAAPYLDADSGLQQLLGSENQSVFFNEAVTDLPAGTNPYQSFAVSGTGFTVARGAEVMERGISNSAPSSCTGIGSGGTCAFAQGSDAVAGSVIMTAGTGASTVGTVTFNRPMAANLGTFCAASAFGANWAAPTTIIPSLATRTVTLSWQNASTALTNGLGYTINYTCFDS